MSHADTLALNSVSVRYRLSEKTLLGEEAPEDFEAWDIAAHVDSPWMLTSLADMPINPRLMVSAGRLRGADENALVVSVVPQLYQQSEGGAFSLDVGVGGAWFSRYVFGVQDFGGPFQFALTLGITAPFYAHVGVGYRFMHYSDAGLNGPGTTGADFHMMELRYRF